MTPSVHVVLPGPLDTPTGGFMYDRHMISALRARGWLDGVTELPAAFPAPAPDAVAVAGRALSAIRPQPALLVDGLCFAPLAAWFAEEARRRPVDVLLHHPLCDESGLPPAERERLFVAERDALAVARGVIVTSATTARRLGDFSVGPERIRTVPPGVDGHPRPGSRSALPVRGRPARLLCVASLTRRKGHDVLIAAVARLRRQSWQLRLVGPAPDRAWAGRLRRMATRHGLAPRISFAGARSRSAVEAEFRRADCFVMASYHEGFGIVLAEAGTHGLPVVTTDAGATREAAPANARFIHPGDTQGLARGIAAALAGHVRPPADDAGRRFRPATWTQAQTFFLEAIADLSASRPRS